ncbi:hypothetical protein D187_000229 [Cystobacter fuscus DSM 2262]|uniref:Uncharacterized protein n=1 Tax=Cystobacter fuscus (strain ATCC 25194 / DSM 2262 / NBRC 100088 / M29) TaxID=1242864 RepID=S9PQM7_CYSF2|nr:hypothetical protein [Cystobacter fuscus]EPX64807.1 hypothetical protein D187_000229 [Cystobacter fuscus DSM 2262]
MAKHQLIIPESIYTSFPVRSEAGRLKELCTLVINWKGTWAPDDDPELSLVVAPGDELEIVLSAERHQGGSLWLFKRELPLLLPENAVRSERTWERVDLERGSRVLQVNHALSRDSGESRYDLRVSELGQFPEPIVGQGQAGTLTASKP